jgi:hypothetical protein
MITFSGDFRQFLANELAVFLFKNCVMMLFHEVAVF